MHVGAKNNKFGYEMNGKWLDSTEEEKDLGVKITSDLCWRTINLDLYCNVRQQTKDLRV